jgi:hypothetical protein
VLVRELEPTRLVSSKGDLVTTITVATEAAAGTPDVIYWGAMPLGMSMQAPVTIAPPANTFLSGEDYPALVAVWDNESDAIFDQI